MEINEITEKVIGCLYRVGNTLGGGFVEKVYQNATFIEVGETGLRVQQQVPIVVKYNGIVVGEFFADLVVEELVLVNFYRPKVEIRRLVPTTSGKTASLDLSSNPSFSSLSSVVHVLYVSNLGRFHNPPPSPYDIWKNRKP